MVQIIQAADYEGLGERFTNGIASVSEVAPGTVRIAFYVDRESAYDGCKERVVSDYQIWNLGQLATEIMMLQTIINQWSMFKGRPVAAEAMH